MTYDIKCRTLTLPPALSSLFHPIPRRSLCCLICLPRLILRYIPGQVAAELGVAGIDEGTADAAGHEGFVDVQNVVYHLCWAERLVFTVLVLVAFRVVAQKAVLHGDFGADNDGSVVQVVALDGVDAADLPVSIGAVDPVFGGSVPPGPAVFYFYIVEIRIFRASPFPGKACGQPASTRICDCSRYLFCPYATNNRTHKRRES